MAGDVWFKRDIINALTSSSQAGHMAAQMSANVEFLRGYRAAIENVALHFGIAPALVLPPGRDPPQLDGD